MSKFPLDVLQAINDWQRGYTDKQKPTRIRQIEAAAKKVDTRFRRAERPCYRQMTLSPRYVWQMGEVYHLEETISSWTEHYEVARDFKGGVAPEGMDWISVIFQINPAPEQVVLNLAALYADPDFLAACDEHQSEIARYWDGIGRHKDTQAEVILALDEVRLSDVYAAGGHSSKPAGFLEHPHVQQMLAHYPPPIRKVIAAAIRDGQGDFGPTWLTGERKERILRKWVEHTIALKIKHER